MTFDCSVGTPDRKIHSGEIAATVMDAAIHASFLIGDASYLMQPEERFRNPEGT
jgi:hypothetical protein